MNKGHLVIKASETREEACSSLASHSIDILCSALEIAVVNSLLRAEKKEPFAGGRPRNSEKRSGGKKKKKKRNDGSASSAPSPSQRQLDQHFSPSLVPFPFDD